MESEGHPDNLSGSPGHFAPMPRKLCPAALFNLSG